MKIGLTSKSSTRSRCRRSPTGRSGPGSCECLAWPTCPSGANGWSATGAGRPRAAPGQPGLPSTRSWSTAADAFDAGLLRFSSGGFIGTGGAIETPNQRLNVRHKLAISSPEDLAKVPVGTKPADGTPLLLGDVATVKIDHQPLIGDAVINGGPGLMLIVEKLPWANTLDVTQGVEAAIDGSEPGLPGMNVDTTIFRPASLRRAGARQPHRVAHPRFPARCHRARRSSSSRGGARSISLITIPLSLMASALVLHWRGATINTMILAGLIIALGAVVDDAIVDTENIVRRLRQHRREGGDRSTAKVIFDASSRCGARWCTPRSSRRWRCCRSSS